MSEPIPNETTTGGPVGKIIGKAKAAVASVIGDEELEREGHLQDAAAEAEVVAAREAEEAQRRQEEAAAVERRAEVAAEKAFAASRRGTGMMSSSGAGRDGHWRGIPGGGSQ